MFMVLTPNPILPILARTWFGQLFSLVGHKPSPRPPRKLLSFLTAAIASLLFIASACQSPRKLISTGGESSSSSETTTAPLPESQNPPQPGSNGSQESLPDCSRVEAKLTSTLRGFGWVQVRLRPEPYRYAEAWEDLHQLRQYLVIVTTLEYRQLDIPNWRLVDWNRCQGVFQVFIVAEYVPVRPDSWRSELKFPWGPAEEYSRR